MMNDTTLITILALVPNVNYTDTSDPDIQEHFHWQHRNDIQQMTFEQAKRMFSKSPNYKNWLMPTSRDTINALGLSEDHYATIQHKYRKNRIEFETSALFSVGGVCNG